MVSADEVLALRKELDAKTEGRDLFIHAHEFYEVGLHRFFLRQKLLRSYENIFGEKYKLSFGGTLHHENYGVYLRNGKVIPGVHVDSDYQYFKKDIDLLRANYLLAKLGIFLQDSREEVNILVIPFSHILLRFLGKLKLQKALLVIVRFSQYLLSFKSMQRLFRPKIESGDAVLFDCLTLHASDTGRTKHTPRKYVMYTEVGNVMSLNNFYSKTVTPRARNELNVDSEDQKFERDPMRYTKQLDVARHEYKNLIKSDHIKFFHTLR